VDSPSDIVIKQFAPTLAEHARTLHELYARLVNKRPALLDALKTHLGIEPRFALAVRTVSDQVVTVWFDGLASGHGGIQRYLENTAAWGREQSGQGYEFTDLTELFILFRRALLPLVAKELEPGPEMELTFAALDALERAVIAVLAAAFVMHVREQLIHGAHQRSVGRLAGGLTHALNDTMAIIIGRAQMLEEQFEDEGSREELRTLQKSARAGAESIKRLQNFALEHDGNEPTRLDVNAIISDTVQLTRFRWRDDAEASGIVFEVVQDLAPVPPVIGQAALLRDALVELILNSVEAMPLGGLITLRTEHVQDRVQITVLDQGKGMDTVTLGRASDAFFTTKGTKHIGLGLGTVSSIIRQLGGTFTLTSVPGEGTRAVISLPAAAEIKQVSDLRTTRLARWTKILVVDDEPLVRDVATRTFQRRGFQTVAAASGADALHLFQEQGPFQVALVDLGMPGMNGFDTARALKELKPRPIVILMTGWAPELDTKKMREAGVDRAITKPFEAEQVIQLIDEAMAIQDKL